MMMELIPTLLAGYVPIVSPRFRPGNPTMIMALKVEAFTDIVEFQDSVREFMQRVKEVPPAVGFEEVLLPGEKEARSIAERSEHGIPLPESVWDDLSTLAANYSIPMPEPEDV
jgi:LDH2 family malate/lactate/ureidoglycolate dehydrogenase